MLDYDEDEEERAIILNNKLQPVSRLKIISNTLDGSDSDEGENHLMHDIENELKQELITDEKYSKFDYT